MELLAGVPTGMLIGGTWLPSGDDLISDIERFLRDQGGATRG